MTLNVADISRYQDTSIIPALRGGGTDAIIVGVTFGCAGNNPIYAQQLDATAANGMLRGAYHIRARVNWTPQQEADFFLAHMAGYLDGRTVVALDWEECDTSDEAWALTWLQYVEAKTGIKPWFYVNLSDLLTYRYPSIAAGGYGIWLAQYPYSTVNGFAGAQWQPQAIPAGHTLVAWQYVGTGGTVNGVGQLDLSVAYLNAAGWIAYGTPNGVTLDAGTITPITQDWTDMATQAEVQAACETAVANQLANMKWVVGGRSLFDFGTQTLNSLDTISTQLKAVENIPLGLLTARFQKKDGTVTSVAAALSDLLAKPATVTNQPATSPADDTDAFIARLVATLPAATVAAIKNAL